MAQRKLIQHGASSLTVALPHHWIKDRGLKKGDSVHVDEEGNKLIVSTSAGIALEKVSADISGLDRTSALLYIQSLYRFGYNEIEILFSDPIVHHYRTGKEVMVSTVVHEIVNRCIGAEIIEQSSQRILIKYMGKEEGEDFRVVLRRSFLLLKESAQDMYDAICNKEYALLAQVEEKHDNVNKFVSFCLRLLNKYGYPNVKKTGYYFHIIASLDKIMDILKYNARDMVSYEGGYSKHTLTIWKEINKSLFLYYDLFYNFDMQKVNDLSRNRDHVKSLMRKHMKEIPVWEYQLLLSMRQILELLLDLTDYRLGLEH